MHSGLHTLAHRAPQGARSRVRWQPYASLQSSLSTASLPSRSPPANYLNTPSSVPPPSPYTTPATSYIDRPKPTPSLPSSSTLKDPQSKKHAIGLVDQAVKTICDIWRNDDIPTIFLAGDRAALGQFNIKAPSFTSTSELLTKSRNRNTQLPSPVSPTTQPSPPPTSCSEATTADLESILFDSKPNLVPIRGFVHEVLRRSRTSGCVLQTALCYLEAIRHRLPDLIKQEKAGQGLMVEPDISTRISLATPAELDIDHDSTCSDDGMDTIRINDAGSTSIDLDSCEPIPEGDTLKKPKGPSPPLAPLPPLPSPLLCPRRAFLAALILASKFTQDKCYSNRAWAKLSGLPAREISRCERALGDALDWRLWVGKYAQAEAATPPSPPLVSRPVTRCRSESDLRSERVTATFLISPEELTLSSIHPSPSHSRPAKLSGLRRSSTLPADAFTPQRPPYTMEDSQGRQDLVMSSPDDILPQEMDQSIEDIEYPPTEVIYPMHSFGSPSPTMPSLTYSPSSTESSSGDRTIQTSFLDDAMPPLPPGADPWIWSEASPPPLGSIYASTIDASHPAWAPFSAGCAVYHMSSSKPAAADFPSDFDQPGFMLARHLEAR